MDILYELLKSWQTVDHCEHDLDEIVDWYHERNSALQVHIVEADYSDDERWVYDREEDKIMRSDGGFFSICGLKNHQGDVEQPVLLQDEIGYLGFLMQKRNGLLHILVQAKIEPGNINKTQLSPTIQATKSNFTQVHKGRKPAYLDYFKDARSHHILFDQIQSEQSSRFVGKRNRNIVILLDEDVDVDVLPAFRWLSLGQLKALMHFDNMVNMDTRTVLSCLPYALLPKEEGVDYLGFFEDKALGRSVLEAPYRSDMMAKVFNYMNDYKMHKDDRVFLCGLSELPSWHWDGSTLESETYENFKVIFCDISIEQREVTHWYQPLFKAKGSALFALACRVNDEGVMEFLVQAKPEVGCFDEIELAPTWQLEFSERETLGETAFGRLLRDRIANQDRLRNNVQLSEEGGRFYHEQNDNYILLLNEDEQKLAPGRDEGYFWLNYKELSVSLVYNNVLNIQLRNLLSLLETKDGEVRK